MTKEQDEDITVINNIRETIIDYSELVDLQNKIIIETTASLENLLSFNDTEESCLQVVYELEQCQTNCTAEIRGAEKTAIEKVLTDIAAADKANSWCSDVEYTGKMILCPLENIGNSLHQNLWEPIPTPAKYAIAGAVIVATAVAAGYGVHSWLYPVVAPIVPKVPLVVAPIVPKVPLGVYKNVAVKWGAAKSVANKAIYNGFLNILEHDPAQHHQEITDFLNANPNAGGLLRASGDAVVEFLDHMG